MLRILIIDDEAAAGNILKLLIERFIPLEKEIRYCNHPEEALELIKVYQPTLIMLDIEMPNMNGFDFLNRAIGCDFDVIFTTAYDQYAIKAIRFSALDYLLKPVDSIELQSAINRHIIKQQTRQPQQRLLVDNLIANLQQKEPENFKLALATTEGVSFFDPARIMYCEGENNYTRFVFTDMKPLLISKTLAEYEEILSEHHFIRIHKSYLINTQYVVKVDKEGMVSMKDGKVLAMSRRRKEVVMNILAHK